MAAMNFVDMFLFLSFLLISLSQTLESHSILQEQKASEVHTPEIPCKILFYPTL